MRPETDNAASGAGRETPRRDGRSASEWAGPGHPRGRWTVRSLMWSLIVPPKGYRTIPTLSGWVLVLLAFSLGLAAYNTASNILFIALSLLLASLILSGILAWGNFRRNRWKLTTAASFRAGDPSTSWIRIVNDKEWVPTYALAFDVALRNSSQQVQVALSTRLDVGESIELPVHLTPPRRGHEVLEVARVRSFYPFGFLEKMLPGNLSRDIWIWPRRIPYERSNALAPSALAESGAAQRPGEGTDLLSLRPYRVGDPPRAIHWKATARSRRIMVRQLATDASAGYRLLLDAPSELWPDADHFEHLCSLAATLAEDLFREGRLVAACIGTGGWRQVRRISDLEAVLDEIAMLKTLPSKELNAIEGGVNTLTFQPGPGRRVHAYVDGEIAASA